MRMTIIPVPVHRMELVCGLVLGEVAVGVRPVLPVEEVNIILGNDLAGDRVWAEAPPPNVVTQVPVLLLSKLEVEKTEESVPEVELFPACAVTRAMGRVKDEAAQQAKVVIPVPLKSISHSEFILEQKSDPSVKALFELVSPVVDMETSAQGYFVESDVLLHKWCAQGGNFVGKPIVQIVVPAKIRNCDDAT